MKNKTISESSTLWLEEKRLQIRESSYAAYLLTVRTHILPAFGKKRELTEQDVQRFIQNRLDEGYRPKTVRDIILVLKMIYTFSCHQARHAPPQWNLRFPRENTAGFRAVLIPDEFDRLLRFIRDRADARSLGLAIALFTGMRIGELCALQWNDIDWDRRLLRVDKTLMRLYRCDSPSQRSRLVIGPPKSASSCRDIPIHGELYFLLSRCRPASQDGSLYLLTGLPQPTEPRCYRHWFASVLDRLGLPRLRFHTLRHSFATRCIERDCDCKTVSALLGHADVSTTIALYVHPGLEQKRRCIDRFFGD